MTRSEMIDEAVRITKRFHGDYVLHNLVVTHGYLRAEGVSIIRLYFAVIAKFHG